MGSPNSNSGALITQPPWNEAIEMHVWKLSMGLEKQKFDVICAMLQNKWFMVCMHWSSFGCMWEVAKHKRTVTVAQGNGGVQL